LHTCAPINQCAVGFSEFAILEFEIYKIKSRLQPLLIRRTPVRVAVIVCAALRNT
jgi:hypothetical protein